MYNDDTMKNKEGFVLDIHEIRQKIKISSIYDIPMRVTFYARVSSEKD